MDWVVYVKESFRNYRSVMEYLGRYTHRIAISNHRIKNVENNNIVFSYKDYKENGVKKEMNIQADEFIRRFLLHVVPPRYVRIRYYGILANRNRKENLRLCRDYYHVPEEKEEEESVESWDSVLMDLSNFDVHRCPRCKEGLLYIDKVLFGNRSPPVELLTG